MFFLLSKVLGFFATPSNAVATVCAVGLLLALTRWRRSAPGFLATGTVLLLVLGYSPLGNVLLLPLSERFPAWRAEGGAPDGIVVLGGAIDSEITAARGALEMDASAERIVAMLRLARQYPSARIVFSGGSASLIRHPVAEGPIAGRLLEEFGTARERIVIEDRSRTTAENAAFTRALVAPKPGQRWLLVTSAFHMPRSVGAFRKAGFEVEAYPVDWRTVGPGDALLPFAKLSAGLSRVDVAAHEWIGLIGYWAAGRSSELFPGPRAR